MQFLSLLSIVTAASALPALSERASDANADAAAELSELGDLQTAYGKPYAIFQPKVFVISMFELERDPWLETLDFEHNITVPGLSPSYPTIHCTTNYSICQMTTGEGEINAASSVTALVLNPLFDLSRTYFLIAGIAGGEPDQTTLGSVTFAKYAVQAGLEYEIDDLELPAGFTGGFFAYGTDNQQAYPTNVYGTEVFELNEKLRDRAVALAKTATLNNGTDGNAAFRKLYSYPAAQGLPSVVACDGLTSDMYFSGNVLGDYFANFTKLMTNGSASYCSSAQEDSASLEAFTRLDMYGLVDFNRVVVMRTISDFTRPPPSMADDTFKFFTDTDFGGISASLENLVLGGMPFVQDVVQNWDSVYKTGEKFTPDNYVGDIFGTLGGTPDFGLPTFLVA